MIKLLITLTIILVSHSSFSQENNEFRIYVGIANSELLRNENLDGVGNVGVENFAEFGFRYLRKINNQLAIETGVNYERAVLIRTPHFKGEPVYTRGERFELLSIPAFINYTFWNFLFINGGPMVDFQLTETTSDSQSGIGYGLGFGGKFNFNNFSIYLNPNYKRHAVIPFDKQQYHQKLTEFGIQFGLGYRF